MFGLILGAIAAGGAVIGTAVKCADNNKSKKEAIKNGKTEYYDHFGTRRDIKTDTALYIGNVKGDRVLMDYKGNVFYNLSEEKANRKISEGIEQGKTLIYYKKDIYKDRLGLNNKVEIYYDTNLKEELIKVSLDISFWRKDLRNKVQEALSSQAIIEAYESRSGVFLRFDDYCEEKIPTEIKIELLDYLNERQREYMQENKTFATDQISLSWG